MSLDTTTTSTSTTTTTSTSTSTTTTITIVPAPIGKNRCLAFVPGNAAYTVSISESISVEECKTKVKIWALNKPDYYQIDYKLQKWNNPPTSLSTIAQGSCRVNGVYSY